MGCSTSSQTSAEDTTRPSAKPEESNGASTTGVANENGNIAEDSETIPDQTPAEPVAAADTSGEGTSASPPAGEESQPSTDSTPAENAAETPAAETPAAETPAAETPAAETPAAETPATETPAAAPEQEATATHSEPEPETPAPSE
ncbi:cytochrome c1 [Nothobranchius furzeri]|nr:transcript variant X2 [Nothobranchius furzeri]